jgi:hypothetical protein
LDQDGSTQRHPSTPAERPLVAAFVPVGAPAAWVAFVATFGPGASGWVARPRNAVVGATAYLVSALSLVGSAVPARE